MKANISMMLVIFIVSFVPFDVFAQTAWEIDKNTGGISVYTRAENNSEYNSFKAVVSINASSEEVLAILNDVAAYGEWFGYT